MKKKMRKGVSIRFLVLMLLMTLVIILVAYIFFNYAPDFFNYLANLVKNPPEVKT